ncbi:cell wall hydrolase [Qipengyuania marisflavi]|uniref:Cell wall hydrolase n=1 Tax=Qipengyuania marisflavi TaxID=2486356 RepID=A0A5S3P5I8_9SPHN|nr:cell wall hydrolase [Qipengyuania marisflavi]TMM48214.1 cell wall hydrolase [Qipengyuania marisflavi]
MIRKTTTFTAALAATLIITLAGFESSGANAQSSEIAAPTITTEAVLTDEVVPVFVESPVVQELPEAAEPESAPPIPHAETLAKLVKSTATPATLSEEMQCLAGAIYFESRGEPLAGQLAVARVIINRAEARQFPSSYCGVVYQRSQFSFVKNGRMPRIKTGSAAWRKAKAIARIAHENAWDSAAQDSLYFHAKYVKPSWSRRKTARATINTHVFYK